MQGVCASDKRHSDHNERSRRSVSHFPAGDPTAEMSTVRNTSAVGPAFLRTQRHGPSGVLSLVSGGLMFAAFNIDGSIRVALFGASTLALAAMFAALFWPKRGVR